MIEFDVETTGLQHYSHDLFLAAFGTPNGAGFLFHHPAEREAIQRFLDLEGPFRAWNTKFDLHFLESAGYRLPPESQWHDGMVAAHIVNEQRSVALKAVAEEMFGEEERATERAVKEWLSGETRSRRKEAKDNGLPLVEPTYRDVPDELMEPYALQDVKLTREVCKSFERVFAG